jgi:F-type H+-transporting ATPase subunit delta
MSSALFATEIAEPYAQALMSIAQSENLTDRIGEDISALLNLLKESDDLRTCLSSPLFEPEVKKAIIKQIAGDQLHPYTLNFLLLLADKGRILFLKEIGEQFRTLLRQLSQTVLAEVTSAIELTDAQKETNRQKVASLTQARQVELETQVDPDIIGGVIIRVGSQVFDASLRGQLRRISTKLSAS